MPTTLADVPEFLALRRIAFVGLSRRAASYDHRSWCHNRKTSRPVERRSSIPDRSERPPSVLKHFPRRDQQQ
jgi:hypothetical protein